MNKEILRREIIELIEEKIGIDEKILIEYSGEHSLFEPLIGMKPRDLLTIFFEIQGKYRIDFVEHDILERRFDFLTNIVDAIVEKVV